MEIKHELGSPEELARRFEVELKALLAKYQAELAIVEGRSHGYSEYRSTSMKVTFHGIFSPEHDVLREYSTFDLASYVSPE